MVLHSTAHRVFPAKRTGGNGIAGTAIVPTGYRIRPSSAGCNDIELYETRVSRDLDDHMVVGPGYFETVSEFVDRTCACGTPDQKAYSGGAEIQHEPKQDSS